jgi:hypothetical protein
MTRAVPVFLLVLCLFPPVFAQEGDSNNCHDPSAWTDWQERVSQHPEDQELQILHALWLGLCVKVERGDVSLDDAITIFENARSTLIQQRQEEKGEKKPPAPL